MRLTRERIRRRPVRAPEVVKSAAAHNSAAASDKRDVLRNRRRIRRERVNEIRAANQPLRRRFKPLFDIDERNKRHGPERGDVRTPLRLAARGVGRRAAGGASVGSHEPRRVGATRRNKQSGERRGIFAGAHRHGVQPRAQHGLKGGAELLWRGKALRQRTKDRSRRSGKRIGRVKQFRRTCWESLGRGRSFLKKFEAGLAGCQIRANRGGRCPCLVKSGPRRGEFALGRQRGVGVRLRKPLKRLHFA